MAWDIYNPKPRVYGQPGRNLKHMPKGAGQLTRAEQKKAKNDAATTGREIGRIGASQQRLRVQRALAVNGYEGHVIKLQSGKKAKIGLQSIGSEASSQADFTNFRSDKTGIKSRQFNPTKVFAKSNGRLQVLPRSKINNDQSKAGLWTNGYFDALNGRKMPDKKLAFMRTSSIVAYKNGYAAGVLKLAEINAELAAQHNITKT